ncbi:MAG: hypothetical protein JWP64_3215 [Pseudonocardia sp.]|jgi:hypothetical protein|nr:hypothetical protein [Pseudonocardia sp.]MDT7698444.1 hypothetical protein [Pseudonocardiales bacterium]
MRRMSAAWVLDEDDALELLAYLVTAARTQVDEAAEYGPMRLLTAAHRLAEKIDSRSSDGTGALVDGPLRRMPLLAVPRDDRDGYVARLDEVCRSVAELLVARYASASATTGPV